MNPLTGALKYLGSGLFNTLLALVFFIVAAHYTTPAFVGKVAIIQLLEVVTALVLVFLPQQLVTRDIAESVGSGKPDHELVGTALSLSLLTAPAFLFLLFFPEYVWLSIPYLFLYLYSTYQSTVMSGRGKFTEANIGYVIFSTSRWGFSLIAVIYHSIFMFILIWTLGTLARVIYQQFTIGKSSFAFSKGKFLETFRVGLPLYLSNVSNLFASQGDRLSTAFLLGSYSLGIYQLMVLIAGVPNTLIGSITQAILPATTYYKARGHGLLTMSSISFRLMMMLSVIATIVSIAIAPPVVVKFFPQYVSGVPSLELLLFALLLATPFGALVNFVVVVRKGFRPLLVLSVLDAALVIITSIILIPRIGIFGAAISQAIVQGVYAAYITVLAQREGAFHMGRLEALTVLSVLSLALIPIAWEASLVVYLILIRTLGTFTKNDLSVINQFLPDRLKFITTILKPLAK
ncbi:MAG: oligosaccharide flippase family protein [Nitrososphaerota archaeon]|nr:oligosaccharide flippase family protein [Nitrososphaerota archaeon]MDG6931133.1 oligosaccharide flippase family protein [Nitrososphaerota archaeon]